MTTKRRAQGGVQGELEMAGGDPAPGAPAPSAETEAPAVDDAAEGADATPAADAETAADPLAEALDGLDRRVTLLVERYAELAARHRETVEERRGDREALERLVGSGADPAALDARLRELEAENDRLARHAGFLEERIQGLLSRVRYVMEA